MLKFDKITEIIYNIKNTNKTFSKISKELNISYVTISDINLGKKHKRDYLEYPLRKTKVNIKDSNNLKNFCNYLYKRNYTAKQIHIICGEYAYSTITRYINSGKEEDYIPTDYLEERKRTFDIISKPNELVINQTHNLLLVEDLVYIKFLARMRNCTLAEVIYIFLPIINFETIVWETQIETLEDIERYLDWGGTKSKIIQMIKLAFNNKIYRLGGEAFYYDDVSIEALAATGENLDKEIIKNLIRFETKEEHKKRGETPEE